MNRPPVLGRWLLSVRLPASERDEIIGDLNEEFAEVAAARGRVHARIWYWRHALRLSWTLGGRQGIALTGGPKGSRGSFDEFRYALRRLIKQPGASIASIVTLALSIGAAVAAWTLLSAVMLRPLPLVKTDGLVTVGVLTGGSPFADYRSTHKKFRDITESGTFARVAAHGQWPADVTVDRVVSSRTIYFVSANYFELLGVQPRAGRGFTPDDDRPGASHVVVVSDRFWRTVLLADANAVGREILMSGQPVKVVGIMPAAFDGLNVGRGPDLYTPIHGVADLTGNRTNWLADPASKREPNSWLQIVAQLRPGTTAAQAAQRLRDLFPVTKPRGDEADVKDARYVATDLAMAAVPEGIRPAMRQFARMLAITVSLLLLIGCLTVGMLVLLRTEARRDEFALCLAMGATRLRLAAGVLVEGGVLSAAGAALAIPLSLWLIAGVRTFALPGNISIERIHLALDWRTLAAAAGAAATATLLIALVAGVFGVSANVADSLRSRAGVTPRATRQRTRALLVIAQMAVAVVLLAGAGLFARSVVAALHLNANVDTGRIVTGRVAIGALNYSRERAQPFFTELRNRLAQSPEIRSASISGFTGGWGNVIVNGESRKLPRTVALYAVDEHYFPTVGLPVMRGRDFRAADTASAPLVVIVTESFGRLLANGGDPIGLRLKSNVEHEVVGVVPDVITNIGSLEPLAAYSPIAQVTSGIPSTLTLRAAGDPALAVRDAVSMLHAMEPAIEKPKLMTIDAGLMEQMGPQRFGVTVLGALGGIAALLTLFGMFVLAESMAASRRREMGVRAALGASRRQLTALVFSHTTKLVAIGIGTGLLLAWFGSRLIRTFLFRVEPFDAVAIGSVIALMFILAIAVTLRPALRAARVDLARTLRDS